MEEEREESGITFGDICRTIFSQKWLALIIAFVVTIVGTIGIYLVGKFNKEYSVSFVLQLPGTDDSSSTTYKYPDGESLYFTEIISSANLSSVADDDVDVEKMLEKGDITIKRNLDEVSSDATSVEVYDLAYTVSVKASYFKDMDNAKKFLIALAEIPLNHIANMDINYDRNLTTSKSALTYGDQLNALQDQLVYIQSLYSGFIGAYGSEFIIEDGRTLAQVKSEVDQYLASPSLFTVLKNVAIENGYVKSAQNADEKAKYESDLFEKQRQLKVATETRDYLVEIQNNSGTVIYGDQISSISREIATLNNDIEDLNRYISSFTENNADKIGNAAFEARIAEVESKVTQFTNDIKPIASYVYGKITKVNYLNSNIETTGGIGLVMSGGISLVIGILLAAIVAYIVGWNKQKKPAKTEKNTAEVPVFVQAQAQTAVTEDDSEENKEDKDIEEDK